MSSRASRISRAIHGAANAHVVAGVTNAQVARTRSVVFEGVQRDTSRVDAQQVRLRLFDGDDYLQFVTIPVPSPEMRRFVGEDANVTPGQLWWHIAKAAQPYLEDAIRTGLIPMEDPTMAFEVELYGVLEHAVRTARAAADK